MTSEVNLRFKVAGHSATDWAASNPVLNDREWGDELDTGKVKRGPGAWNSLPYRPFWSAWGQITGTLSAQTDLQAALDAKEPTITAGTTGQYRRGDNSWQTLDKAAVGLGNLSNSVTGSLGSVMLSNTPTVDNRLNIVSTGTARLDFTSGSTTGLFSIDTGGNMVFRQNTSGSMFFDFFNAVNFRNSAFTNVVDYTSGGVISALGGFRPKTNDGAALGSGANSFSDLFLALGGVINWANGNATLTHSTGRLTLSVPLSVASDTIRITTEKTPSSATDTGTKGDICWDANFLYLCIATNTWRRIAHATW